MLDCPNCAPCPVCGKNSDEQRKRIDDLEAALKKACDDLEEYGYGKHACRYRLEGKIEP
jgi:hypothetical protein